MNENTPWEESSSAEGTTDSERVLTRLARKAFLSLWSYPNVYTDEGRKGKGDGKELVDLLVVFGNDVLLFSDKACAFHTDIDPKIAWTRWYKRSIEKSARQLAGAENFVRRFPKRVYVDRQCQTPLPIALPDPSVARYYLIAVTRGGHEATARFYGRGSGGSLLLNNMLEADDHYTTPFQVGFPLKGRRFIHILDEVTVDLLLEELDTVPDIVAYLSCKESFFGSGGVYMNVAGEEELLAQYMCTMEDGRHALPKIPPGTGGVMLLEGDWSFYQASSQRAAKRDADKGSYMWDDLLEYQASFIRAGTAIGLPDMAPETFDHERILRALAAESRLSRRELAAHFRHALSQSEPGKKFARMTFSCDKKTRAYVFLTAPKDKNEDYQKYREKRSMALLAYCHGIKLRFPFATEAIGIASEPFSELVSSQDFLYVDLQCDLGKDEAAMWREAMEDLDVLQQPQAEVHLIRGRSQEFPVPFHFGGPKFIDYETGMPINRAARRKMDRAARNKKNKKTR